jgi:hypothetical protein
MSKKSYINYEEYKLLLEENNELKQKLSSSNNLELIDEHETNRFNLVNIEYENYLKIIQEKCDAILKQLELNNDKLKNIIEPTDFEFMHNNKSLAEKIDEIGTRINRFVEYISKDPYSDPYSFPSPILSLSNSNVSEQKKNSYEIM